MCGVAGIFHYAEPERSVDQDLLMRMTRLLTHRGPDDEGFHIDGPLGLGHRRLSIVDLSPTGRQPMHAGDGCVISYNGEAYNHARFRSRLEAKGVRFRGTSDTETVLHLIREDGPRALAELAGIFGLAFWDARHARLLLARDALGVKQMYFHDDGKRIVFASEIKAILADRSVPREVDPASVSQYLHFHTPLFERTFFRGIQQVCAGQYLEVNRHGATPRTYWRPDGFEPSTHDLGLRVRDLKELLREVVRDQLMSDVPVGAFFSGGIDSTAVAAYALEIGKPIRGFGVHFSNAGVIDERPYQEAAAKALGLELELTTVGAASFPGDLARLMYFQDQPVIGAAMLPMFAVSELASRRVKVCLGGQAADEIFGGYARHALAQPMRVLGAWFKGRGSRRVSDAPASDSTQGTGSRVGGNLGKQLFDARNLRRLVERIPTLADWRARYFGHVAKVPLSAWRRVFADPVFVARDAAFAQFCEGVDACPATEPVDKVFDWERRTYLTGLFQQDDRMSMAHSLESRVPLADPRVVRFALHTPAEMKLRAGATKWILRQAVADRIPPMVLNRRKVGFDTPAEAWMRGPHQDFVRDTLLSGRATARGWTTPVNVERWLADVSRPYWFDVTWKLLCLEIWARTFIDGEHPIVRQSSPPPKPLAASPLA